MKLMMMSSIKWDEEEKEEEEDWVAGANRSSPFILSIYYGRLSPR